MHGRKPHRTRRRMRRDGRTAMNANPERSGLLRANRALDASNFFLADVRDGLGPYLAVYLLTI